MSFEAIVDDVRRTTDIKRLPSGQERGWGIKICLKGIDYCPIEIIKGLTDKGQFQYLTKLKGPQVGNNLYTTQFLSLR